jgi:hypothetical protein
MPINNQGRQLCYGRAWLSGRYTSPARMRRRPDTTGTERLRHADREGGTCARGRTATERTTWLYLAAGRGRGLLNAGDQPSDRAVTFWGGRQRRAEPHSLRWLRSERGDRRAAKRGLSVRVQKSAGNTGVALFPRSAIGLRPASSRRTVRLRRTLCDHLSSVNSARAAFGRPFCVSGAAGRWYPGPVSRHAHEVAHGPLPSQRTARKRRCGLCPTQCSCHW